MLARTILFHDPYFTLFRSPWFVASDGSWSEPFRAHAAFKVLVDALTTRLAEELDTTVAVLKVVTPGVTTDAANPEFIEVAATPQWQYSGSDHLGLRLFAPTEPLLTQVTYSSKFGTFDKSQRSSARIPHVAAVDSWWPSPAGAKSAIAAIVGFEAGVAPRPILASPAKGATWASSLGAPKVLVGQDGIYI